MTSTSAIDHVRHLLRDRQVKDGARGTIEEVLCLDVSLLEERGAIQDQLATAETEQTAARAALQETAEKAAPKPGKKRLGDPAPVVDDAPEVPLEDGPEVVELRAKLADVDERIRNASIRLKFRSIGSNGYQEIVNRHPDSDDNSEARAAFLNDVIGSSLASVSTLAGDELDGLTWDEIVQTDDEDNEGPLGYGEWESLALRVTGLNRRKVDVPFSLRSSSKTPD